MASIVVNGDSSGSVTLSAPAVAGSTVLTLPSTSGTLLTTASGQWITTGSNIYYNTGSVGIGTTSPASPLQVNTAGVNTTVQINSTDANGGYGANLSLNNTGTGGRQYAIYSTSNADGDVGGGKLKFTDVTASATRMVIDSSGKVYVGTTTNANSGAMIVQQAANGTGITVNGVNNTSGAVFMYFTEAGANCGYIQRVGTTGAVVYSTSSDYRLKENIAPITGALATVAKLKPVTYDWKAGGSSQGFIAHELQEVIPDAVTGVKDQLNEDGSINAQGIDQSRIVATLTAAIQELKAELDTVKAELAALKG